MMPPFAPDLTLQQILIRAAVIAIWFPFTFRATTMLVRRIVLRGRDRIDIDGNGQVDDTDSEAIRIGRIIGKCENVLILLLILFDQGTGLALIFAAKSLVRKDAISKNAEFYLAGTMVNFTASLVLAYALRVTLSALP